MSHHRRRFMGSLYDEHRRRTTARALPGSNLPDSEALKGAKLLLSILLWHPDQPRLRCVQIRLRASCQSLLLLRPIELEVQRFLPDGHFEYCTTAWRGRLSLRKRAVYLQSITPARFQTHDLQTDWRLLTESG